MVSDCAITGMGISENARNFFDTACQATKDLMLETRFPTLETVVKTIHAELTSAGPVESMPLFALGSFQFQVAEASPSESFSPGGTGISGQGISRA